MQHGLTLMESWCEHWNIKINADNTQAIYFSHRHRPVEAFLALKWRQVPFVNHVKYLGEIFDKKITWRLHIETIALKALWIFIRIYPLLKSESLSVGIKLILYKALILSICLPCVGIRRWQLRFEIAASAKTKFSGPLIIYQGAYRSAICTWRSKFHIYMIYLKETMQGATNGHIKSWKRQYSPHWPRRSST